jgi:hypothetical protein
MRIFWGGNFVSLRKRRFKASFERERLQKFSRRVNGAAGCPRTVSVGVRPKPLKTPGSESLDEKGTRPSVKIERS